MYIRMIEFKSFTFQIHRHSYALFLASFLILSIGFTFFVSFLYSDNVFGHAFLLESNPASSASLESAPARVEVFLSEPVDDSYSEVKVIGPDGKQIDNKDTQHFDGDQSTLGVTMPEGGLEDGVYTVSVKMLSQIDGHVTDGAFVFGIGEKTSVPTGGGEQGAAEGSAFDQLSVPDAIARFPALVGQVVVVGSAFCALWLWRPFAKLPLLNGTYSTSGQEYDSAKHKEQKRVIHDAVSQFRESIDQRMVKTMLIGAAVVVAADFGMIYALAYSLDIGMVEAMTTKFGNIWFVRTAVSILLFALIIFVYLKLKRRRISMPSENMNRTRDRTSTSANMGILSKTILIAILTVGIFTLLTTSLMGHGAAITSGAQIPITIDFVHNLAASIWIGGVIYIALAVVPRLKHSRNLDDRLKCSILSIVIPRFSTLPVVVLGILVITGPFLLYLLEDDLNLTFASLYGKALVAKLVFAGIMLALGGYNQRIVHRNALRALTKFSQCQQEEQQVVVSGTKDTRKAQPPSSTQFSSGYVSGFPPIDKEGSGASAKLSHLLSDIQQKIRFGRSGKNRGRRDFDYDDVKTKNKDKNKNKNKHNDYANLGEANPSGLGMDSRPTNNTYPIVWSRIISRFSWSIRTEAILGILLLAAVAVLTNTGLPASEFQGELQQISVYASQSDIQNLLISTSGADNGIGGGGYSDTQYLENATARINLNVEPFTVGDNNFEIEFTDISGNPIDMQTVGMKLTQTDENIGPIEIQTNEVSEGHFAANASFGLAGKWDVIVEGVRSETNTLNLIATFKLFVKPDLDQIDYSASQVPMPVNGSQPLYPVYDSSRNSIWVGDTSLSSGRIFEYNIASNKYLEHRINGTNIVTTMALDKSNDRIWFIDPISKALGVYDPEANSSKLYSFPNDRIVPSSIAFRGAEFATVVGNNNNNNNNGSAGVGVSALNGNPNDDLNGAIQGSATVWITSPSTGEVLIFDTGVENYTNIIPLPTPNSNPLGIAIDSSNGQIWIAEGAGKIANIDPAINFTVNEFAPGASTIEGGASGSEGGAVNDTLISPTALLIDPNTRNIYISEHDGHVVSVFDPVFRTFSDFPSMAEDSLPFGMALDKDRNLWVAEHVTNRLTVVDPSTGKNKEVTLPSSAPFVQYLTTDNDGKIWFAAQRGNSLGYITPSVNLGASISSPSSGSDQNQGAISTPGGQTVFTPLFNIGYEYLIGPIMAMGILACAAFYVNSVFSLKASVKQVNSLTISMREAKRSDRSEHRTS
jgi:methionine-rich copper-binding protein CopC/putative copper export protein/streptogramin lyase